MKNAELIRFRRIAKKKTNKKNKKKKRKKMKENSGPTPTRDEQTAALVADASRTAANVTAH